MVQGGGRKRIVEPLRRVTLWLIIALLLLPCGCIPLKQTRVAAVALTVKDVANAAAKQSDPSIIREGMPAYLMLMDGLIESYPENKELLTAACQAYSSYASSFLGDNERIKAVYLKAKIYGFRSLAPRGAFAEAASGSLEEFRNFLSGYGKSDVPALFWTASAWAGWIGADVGGVEAMADIPMLEATIRRVLELDESFNYGSPHLLMGSFLAAKPAVMGGDLKKAKWHFDRAFALGADHLLMSRVLYAQYYAKGMNDRPLFVGTLQGVLASPADTVPELTLTNVIAKQKARSLLEKTEEYFAETP